MFEWKRLEPHSVGIIFIKEQRELELKELVTDFKRLVWIRIRTGCGGIVIITLQALQSEKAVLTCVYHFSITQGEIYDDSLNF